MVKSGRESVFLALLRQAASKNETLMQNFGRIRSQTGPRKKNYFNFILYTKLFRFFQIFGTSENLPEVTESLEFFHQGELLKFEFSYSL